MKTYLFRIFNRWGELIFESDSIEKRWDGTIDGGKKIAQQDVYSYTLSVVSFERKQFVYTGRITLVR
jgi:gliding motility-associated-like protein